MIDFTGYRRFSIAALPNGLSIDTAPQLIDACQIKHMGLVEGRMGNAGGLALAKWIIANRDYVERPKPGTHPLQSGMAIERLLAGDILPEEQFAIDLAEATEGAVLPEMFGLPAQDLISSALTPLTPSADEKGPASAPLPPFHGRKSVPSNVVPLSEGLPALGALGGALPPGRLFHPIADPRFPEGFVLTGCGVMLCLDASTATAMRDAIDAGLDHLAAMRGASGRVAA